MKFEDSFISKTIARNFHGRTLIMYSFLLWIPLSFMDTYLHTHMPTYPSMMWYFHWVNNIGYSMVGNIMAWKALETIFQFTKRIVMVVLFLFGPFWIYHWILGLSWIRLRGVGGFGILYKMFFLCLGYWLQLVFIQSFYLN
jgi:hypothetical protein